ncbi:LacI family DNA-binding transcriptional regulator [Kordiimonas sp. SCSIO 12603]|uniref:LacI family DNA-binding transcriptional regulator n=1 Tax=Kordiimonas sp. SCSIO 12603 TaxID=2829596 RepID=UPI0021026966|nr:LacI family DNA-binding transcriptional regulator [Kordiimonas sp. SCSIO 12603]UTW60196.1 LacI family DNA-binding transcriptional regulator [Kordiimonas sp. SCSIO 12603]
MVNPEKNTGVTSILAVAKAAGVSKATVSRVLNNRPGVNAKTKAKVLKVIEDTGYQPDETARNLSFGKSSKVGLNTGFSSQLNVHFFLFRQYLESALFSKGMRVEQLPTDERGLFPATADHMVIASIYDDDPRVAYLQERNIPFVSLGKSSADFWVASDEYSGGQQAAEHLLKLGHKDILVLAGSVSGDGAMSSPLHTRATSERIRGVRDALGAAGIELPNKHILEGDFTGLGAFLAVRQAIRDGLKFTAIFALSDVMAAGAIKALEDHDLRVPDDVSIIGYDEIPEVGEAITTIRQNTEELAHAVADLLDDAIEGAEARSITVPVELVVRGTTQQLR